MANEKIDRKISKPKNPYYNPVGENRILGCRREKVLFVLLLMEKKSLHHLDMVKKASHCL